MEIDFVKREGRVEMAKTFDQLCSLLRNGSYTLKITRKRKPRTVPQNSLMWMWFKFLEDEFGQPKDDWHDYYCLKFLSRHVAVGSGYCRLPGKTSVLDTEAFTEFLNKVQADVAAEHGIRLPVPEDLIFSDFAEKYG